MKKSMVLAVSFCALLIAVSAGGCTARNAFALGGLMGYHHHRELQKQEAQEQKESQEFYHKFLRLRMGSSYEDARSIMGTDGVPIDVMGSGDWKMESYKWKGPRHIIMGALFQNGALINKQCYGMALHLPKGKGVYMDDYHRIRPSMSYEDVKQVIGFDGILSMVSQDMDGLEETFYWNNNDASFVQVSFKNGRVYGKSQTGLQ